MTVCLHTCGLIFPTSYLVAWPRLGDSWPGLNSAACGFQAKLASAIFPNAMASPNHDQHLSTNSQFIRCQYESYVIVHRLFILFIPMYSYVKDSFLPIGTLLAKGKPPASEFGTSYSSWDKVDALEPSHGILSGSSDRVPEAIGLTLGS